MKLRLEVEPCETIQDACNDAQWLADKTAWNVEFEFNGVDCVAVPGGEPTFLHERWSEVKDKRHRVTSKDDD
jgi:pyruvate-formate lyase-activating enzyme